MSLFDTDDDDDDVQAVDHRAPLDARALDWFAARITVELDRDELKQAHTKHDISHERVKAVLVAEPKLGLVWMPAPNYKGNGFSAGEWVCYLTAYEVEAICRKLIQADNAADDAARCASLDDWLAAHASGALKARGADGGTHEWNITNEQDQVLCDAAERRRALWPRNCRKCGESFRPENVSTQVRRTCPKCRQTTNKGTKS